MTTGEGLGLPVPARVDSAGAKESASRRENSPKGTRNEALNRSSRRKALTSLQKIQMEPPYVGCYKVHGKKVFSFKVGARSTNFGFMGRPPLGASRRPT